MAREYLVKASNFYGTYTAGRYVADSSAEAVEMARREYARSPLGRNLGDVGGFRFWVSSEVHEDNDSED